MNTELGEEAEELGRVADRAVVAAGGDQLPAIGEAGPARRELSVVPVLAELGAWELDPRGSVEELEAAAALSRCAGYRALPDPVAERLARPRDLAADALLVVGPGVPAGRVAGLEGRWVAVSLDGRRSRAVARDAEPGAGWSAVVVRLDLQALDERGHDDLALGLVLPCWSLLGLVDRALDLTRDYVLERQQFGQPLAAFQGVQFQLADAEVERAGLAELAKHALWRVGAGAQDALLDALALRLAAIEAAEAVFGVAHQLHGAIGFCDETTLSWLSRASQALRRLPLNGSATSAELTRRLGRRGLAGLFDPEPGEVGSG